MRKICALTIIIVIVIIGLHLKGVTFFEYTGKTEGEFIATITSEPQAKEYTNTYTANIDNKSFLIYIPKRFDTFKIGQIIRIKATFSEPAKQRNYGGLDYDLYLKTKKIWGSFKVEEVSFIGNNNSLKYKVLMLVNSIRNNIKNVIQKNLSKQNSGLLMGLLIGDKSNIEKDVLEKYRDVSLSHILAISGAHFSYIIFFLQGALKKLKRKRLSQVFLLIIIIFFILITGATPSVIRAGIMCIMSILASMLKRENDFWTSLALSLLIQIIYNPYVIFNVGLILSYLGVIGIIVFYEKIKPFIKIKSISVCISANIMIIPIIMYCFNTLSFSFFISNFFVSILLGPIIIIGFISTIIQIKPIFIILEIVLNILNSIVNFCKTLPLSNLVVTTPSIISILLFYLVLYYLAKKRKKLIIIFLIISIISNINFQKFNKNELLINFIDVNQGDSCLVRFGTKSLMVDTGGSTDSNYDIGKNVTLPYLLDRKITKLDYVLITHYDADHCQGLMYILEKIKVKNIIMCRQPEETQYYKEVLVKAQENKINIMYVKSGDILNIDKLKIIVIHPQNNYISENVLNNNSIVFKLEYNSFSMLFTGDIEEKAEREILRQNYNLKSTILKVAHHGSKSSSIKEFIEAVNPRIALIGVGKNNKFGHPNEDVIERLEEQGTKIYRTDLDGEVSISVNNNGKIKINKKCGYFIFKNKLKKY